MRFYILANGNGSRWNGYLGCQKHEIEIDGEKLIDRIIRQLVENKQKDIVIVGDYQDEHCSNYINKSERKYDLFVELAEMTTGEFVMLNADCFYTDKIIKDIIKRKAENGWLHWCNPSINEFTGKPYGEGYAHKVSNLNWWIEKLKELKIRILRNEINPNATTDWLINRFLYGCTELYEHNPKYLSEYDVYWNDETDDFDFPEDYDRFMRFTRRIKK